mmetsp:Transcript_5552/g.9504  ORF Transcript_5552/g.9504 Transcript_5552/m.9504 type:complete len:287 (-) Transcript_5552:501-1361(-)
MNRILSDICFHVTLLQVELVEVRHQLGSIEVVDVLEVVVLGLLFGLLLGLLLLLFCVLGCGHLHFLRLLGLVALRNHLGLSSRSALLVFFGGALGVFLLQVGWFVLGVIASGTRCRNFLLSLEPEGLGGLSFLFFLFLLLQSLFRHFSLVVAVGVSEAELTPNVKTPTVDDTVPGPGDGVVHSRLNLNDVVALVGVELLNPRGVGRVLFGADAQLTLVVGAPGEDLVLGVDVEGLVAARKNVGSVFGSHLLNLERLHVLVPSDEQTPSLTQLRLAPSIHFSALSEG